MQVPWDVGAGAADAGPEAYLLLSQLIDQGNAPLFQLASWFSQIKVDPQLGMLPGTEMFYRAMSEMIYSRYGLKGTVQRALAGESPRAIHDSLVLCSTNVNRMAEQAGWLLGLMWQGAAPAARPVIGHMLRLFRAERANFGAAMDLMNRIMGPDAAPAQQRVMRALSATPVSGAVM